MHELDAKWQKKWEEAGIFQPQAGRDAGTISAAGAAGGKFYLTAAFPYPNSPQHIGHGRTYTTTDIYARYMRMKGKNVLFPMAFHVTGTPILAMAKRIAEKDREILDIFEKIYGIPASVSETLTDPKELVAYFSREIEAGMKEMGYSIDWRRKFYSYDPQFNQFIRWQFAKLQNAGYITKGEHPVPWCPVGQTAVGAHDTKGDLDPQIEETSGILFPFEDGFIVCSTYRPETLDGVTNIWLKKDAKYVKVKAEDGKFGKRYYYFAKDVVSTLSMQLQFEVMEEYYGQDLIGKNAKHPVSGEDLPIFDAVFVDPKIGTGAVMCVPSDAPIDYLALRDAGLLDRVRMRQVLQIEGYGKFAAKELVEKMGVHDQLDPKAVEAKHILYKLSAYKGVMVAGEFAGMTGLDAKKKIEEQLKDRGMTIPVFEISNGPIYSRFGGLVGVKIVKDQWFIDYGDEKWKAQATECLSQMRILPEKTLKEYEYTIGWLKEKACTRSAGLGTKFPFDETKMIEALSDSTIYMAYYSVAHIAMKMKPEQLSEQLFDYVFLGNGDASGLPMEAEEMRREFSYWYPLDSRHSATDLVHNHLTFFIFNHVGIFPRECWPKQVVTNGFVLMDGKKMSKSMGNIMPIRAAINEFGADTIRFTVVSGADLAQDTDFNRSAVEGIISRARFMKASMEKYAADADTGEKDIADRWLQSRLHKRAIAADGMYEKFQLRQLAGELFYNTFNDLQWYLKRAKQPKLREFFEIWVPLIAPFMPHYAEELWEQLGKKHYVKDAPFVSVAQLPAGDQSKVDEKLEEAEDYILRAKDDIASILKLLKKEKAEKIELFVAAEWKRKLREIAAKEQKFDAVMRIAMADPEMRSKGADVSKAVVAYMKNAGSLGETRTAKFELSALQSGVKLLEDEFKAKVVFCSEEESSVPKAKNALPGKPSILVS